MDCNASDASVADWLEERFRDELKLVEGRQRALLTQLRLHLRQVQPAVHAVRVIPPELSGSLSPSSGVKTGRGVLRPPEAVKSESEQGDPGSVSRNASTLESQTSRDSKDPQFDRVDASSTSLGLQPISISKTKADDLQVSESDSEDYEKSEHEANMSSVVLKHVSKNAHAPMSRKPSSLKESLARSQSSNKVQRHLPRWHPSRVVRSSIFEVFFSLLILLQALCLAIETQYSGLDWGNKLEYNGYDAPAEHVWPSVPTFLLTTEMLFGSLFTIECMVKFCAFRGEFFCRLWNWFDLLLVLLWIFDTVLAIVPVESPVLRLARLVRLIRLVKLVRAVQGFDSLIIMTTALKDSVNALFWVAMIMLVVEMMFALLLNQVLVALVFGAGHEYSDADQTLLFEYFGTFLRAMLTMFQLTLGTWVPVARILQETVSPYFNIFTILHKVIIGFACIGVINGVFMQETLKVAQNDDIIMMREVAHKERTHARKMKAFFRYADHSKDHVITREEWERVVSGHHAQHWFSAQGLKIKNAEAVFRLLDEDRSNGISMDELIAGVAALQGPAKSLDLAVLTENHGRLHGVMASVMKRLDGIERSLAPVRSRSPSKERQERRGPIQSEEADSWAL